MMTRTHAMTGIAVWTSGDALARALDADHPYYVTLAGALIAWAAAKAPDADHPNSSPGQQINRIIPGMSDAIEAAFGHRGLTHWATTGLLTGTVLGTIAHLIHPSLWWIGLAVSVGWITHIAGDCLTYRGAPAFGPFRQDPIHLPYGYRIECGGPIETKVVYPVTLVGATTTFTMSVALAVFH